MTYATLYLITVFAFTYSLTCQEFTGDKILLLEAADLDPKQNEHQFDFGKVKCIDSVDVRGSLGTYRLMYKHDETESYWRPVTDTRGRRKLFRMTEPLTSHGHSQIGQILLARYIKIVDLFVQNDESLIEFGIYGCDYPQEIFGFTGHSVIDMDLTSLNSLHSYTSSICFHLRTTRPDGVLLSAVGSGRDLVLLQIVGGKMQSWMDLGDRDPELLTTSSSLDDGLWHVVKWTQDTNTQSIWVDGVLFNKSTTNGAHKSLDLDTSLRIGGPLLMGSIPKLAVDANFTGCISSAKFDGNDLLNGAGAQRKGVIWNDAACHDSVLKQEVVTLQSGDSWIEKSQLSIEPILNLNFQLRTYVTEAKIMELEMQKLNSKIRLYLHEGKLKISLDGWDAPETLWDQLLPDWSLHDNLWHTVSLSLNESMLKIHLDNLGPFSFESSALAGFGRSTGKVRFGSDGFVGCLRALRWNGKILRFFSSDTHKGAVAWNTCNVRDRCHPSPCYHSGVCQQTAHSFRCHCKTGYMGKLCRSIAFPHSCSEHFEFGGTNGQVLIDMDGSGPYTPFVVFCNRSVESAPSVISSLSHQQPLWHQMSGFPESGGQYVPLTYPLTPAHLSEWKNEFSQCSQHLSFECGGGASIVGASSLNSWWMGANGKLVHAWGDAEQGTNMCGCGVRGECRDKSSACNCDGSKETAIDEGFVSDLENLPITGLFVGDTDNKNKNARVTVGPLNCQGHVSYDPVTFTQKDGFLAVEQEIQDEALDIYFEFRTSHLDGVLVYNANGKDWVKMFLINGNETVAQISSCGIFLEIKHSIEENLADDTWHSVYFELNVDEATLAIDHRWNLMHSVPASGVPMPLLDGKWKIGASNERSAGFAGAMRSLYINGNLHNLPQSSIDGVGVVPGLVFKCKDDSCANDGICIEKYDSFECNCSETAFGGTYCAQDVGVALLSGISLQYTMHPVSIDADGKIRIGFETRRPNVQLLLGKGLFSDAFLNVTLSSEGHLILTVSDGQNEFKLADNRRNYADGYYYDLAIERYNSEALMFEINEYEPLHLSVLSATFLTQLNSWTIGGAVEGCVSRLRLGYAFPLTQRESARLKVNPLGSTIESFSCPSALPDFEWLQKLELGQNRVENMELPHTHPSIVVDRVDDYDITAMWIPVLIIVSVLLIIPVACCFYRCCSKRPMGTYKTHEGDNLYLTPDHSRMALVSSPNAPVKTKNEFYI